MHIQAYSGSEWQPSFSPVESSPMRVTGAEAPKSHDVVNVRGIQSFSEEDVQNLMAVTPQMIEEDAPSALSLHSGLDANRVFALLDLD